MRVLVLISNDGLSHLRALSVINDTTEVGPSLRNDIKRQLISYMGDTPFSKSIICYYMFLDPAHIGIQWRSVNGMPTALSRQYLTRIYSAFSSKNIFEDHGRD